MAVKIRQNTKYFPCHTVTSTNKGGKLSNISIDNSKIAIEYKDLGVIVLRPIIDRIDFSFTPTLELLQQHDPAGDLQEYMGHVLKSAWHDGKSNHPQLSFITDSKLKKGLYQTYAANLIYTTVNGAPIIIHIHAKKPQNPFIRFDFNPHMVGPKEVAAFLQFVTDELLVTGVAPLNQEQFLAACKIHRVDVAVDILGARPYDLLVKPMANKAVSPSKSHVYKSATGRIETIYTNISDEKTHRTYVYDRRQKSLDKQMPLMYGEFLHSRYECRMQDQKFATLHKAQNRCLRISVDALNLKKYWEAKSAARLFIRVAMDRTLDKALNITDSKDHAKYLKAFETAFNNIWDPKKIWSFWPNCVNKSGFGIIDKKSK